MIGKSQGTTLDAHGVLNYKGRIGVPQVEDFISGLLAEAHGYCYSIHASLTKMYKDPKQVYWRSGMKRDVMEIMAKY